MKSTQSKTIVQASLRTLIVDDNSTNLRILERTLRHHFSHLVDCASVVKANDGDEALVAFENGKFDLVLLDIDMPTISGVDVARKIRETDMDIIVLACTTSDSPAAREQYIRIGMDGCVTKPLNLRELDEALLRCLHSRTHLNLLRYGVRPTKSDRFRTHHGSLPSIDTEPCRRVPMLPPVLSDSVLHDFCVTKSCYIDDLTKAISHKSQHTALDDSDQDSWQDSDVSDSSRPKRTTSSLSHSSSEEYPCKKFRRRSLKSNQRVVTMDPFQFPITSVVVSR